MADFWVSQQKHWCKYCKTYVYNNKATITKHESGNVHKNNVERFLSDVYRKGRQDKKDQESVRRELQRIEKAALVSMGGGQSASIDHTPPAIGPVLPAQPPSRSTSKPPRHMEPPPHMKQPRHMEQPRPSGQPRPPTSVSARHQYNMPPPPSLASLSAPAVPLQGRDEWALPQDDALIGKWQTVSTPDSPTHAKKKDDAPQSMHDQAPEFQDDDEEQDEDLNEFKIKEKEYPLDNSPSTSVDTADSTGLFKKRKLGGKGNLAAKKRMIRKKDD